MEILLEITIEKFNEEDSYKNFILTKEQAVLCHSTNLLGKEFINLYGDGKITGIDYTEHTSGTVYHLEKLEEYMLDTLQETSDRYDIIISKYEEDFEDEDATYFTSVMEKGGNISEEIERINKEMGNYPVKYWKIVNIKQLEDGEAIRILNGDYL